MTSPTSLDQPSHRGIIARNGGPAATARRIDVDPNTVKGWNRLNSIPAAHWEGIAGAGLATLEELAAAAAKKIAAPNEDVRGERHGFNVAAAQQGGSTGQIIDLSGSNGGVA